MPGSRSHAFSAARQPNPVFSNEYRQIIGVLTELRAAAAVTQRELARRLGKAPSHVAMIERGQRRVDTLELYMIARCLGADPQEVFKRISHRIDALAAGARTPFAAA